MGQKTNPISNRIGITRGWDSNWCGGNYAEKIAEDYKIRKYLETRLAKAMLSKIVIERTLKLITVTIHAARPGVIIGKGGTAVDQLMSAEAFKTVALEFIASYKRIEALEAKVAELSK